MLSNAFLTRLLNITHIKTYNTYNISTLILNFKEVLCESCMNFVSTTNRLSVPPAHAQCSSVCHSVSLSVKAKRGIWKRRVFMRTKGNFFFTLTAHGLEELFFQLCCCVSFFVLAGNRVFVLHTYVSRVQYSCGVVYFFCSGGN